MRTIDGRHGATRAVVTVGAALALALSAGCASGGNPTAEGDATTTSSAPSASSTPTATATTSPSLSPSPSATPSPTPTSSPSATRTPSPTPTPTRSRPTPKPSKPAPTPSASKPATPAGPRALLRPGDSGKDVLALQKRLSELGYWLGEPDGTWGGLTTQAVYAVQKAAGLGRDGVAGPATQRAIADGVRPRSRTGGSGVEIDLGRQLLLIVRGGSVTRVLNTSTGSNVPYTEIYKGKTYRGDAHTPSGSYQVFRQVDRSDLGPLGALWRPKYFNGGIAVHGAPVIPPYPASHGCARVSNAAMNMIWAGGYMPVGSRVTVY